MELELDLLQPVGDVFAVDTFDVYAPAMGVVWGDIVGLVLGIEGDGFAAEDCRRLVNECE